MEQQVFVIYVPDSNYKPDAILGTVCSTPLVLTRKFKTNTKALLAHLRQKGELNWGNVVSHMNCCKSIVYIIIVTTSIGFTVTEHESFGRNYFFNVSCWTFSTNEKVQQFRFYLQTQKPLCAKIGCLEKKGWIVSWFGGLSLVGAQAPTEAAPCSPPSTSTLPCRHNTLIKIEAC